MGPLPPYPDVRRPSRVRLGVLAFACSLSLLTYLDRVCISRAAKDIQADLSINDMQMGLVFSSFLLGYLLFEVPGGWLGDRFGARLTLTRIVLWWSLFTTLTGCVWKFHYDSGLHLGTGSWTIPLIFDSFLLLLVVRFLFGLGEAGAYPNLTRVVKLWFPFRERGLAQGSVWMSARLGGAVAPVVIGRLSVALGWRMAFGVLGIIGAVWAVAFFLWFRDRPSQMPGCNEAERDLIQPPGAPTLEPSPTPASGEANITSTPATGAPTGVTTDAPAHAEPEDHGHPWPPARQLAGSLTLWGLSIAAAAVSFGWYFYPTWQPKYLKDVFEISYEGSELLTGLPFLCGAAGCLIGGGLSDRLVRVTGSRRWGRSLLGLVGFTGAGLCVLATGFVTAPWQAILLLCLAFLINDLAIPVIWTVCADVGGRFSGTVAGIMNMVGGIGGMLSPTLIPQVLARLPEDMAPAIRWRIIFAGLATSWFVGAIAWLVVDAGKPMFKESSQ